jgi:hypothetical protein
MATNFWKSLIIDFVTSSKAFYVIISPLALHRPLFAQQRHQNMDKVMGKHGRMYATTTLSVRGGRNCQASSIVGVTKNCWNF